MRLLQLFAISALFVGAVACSGGTSTTTSSKDSSSVLNLTDVNYSGQIAFIRMDSLMRGFGMYIDMSDAFGKKQQKIQTELTNKGRGLEREAMEYQEKAQKGLITQYQAKTTEEGLQKKQQEIVAYRDRVLGELSEEEGVMSAEIYQTVMDYLNEYNADKGYSMIIQTSGGNPVLLGDPKLDITNEVLAELNKRYEAKLAAKK